MSCDNLQCFRDGNKGGDGYKHVENHSKQPERTHVVFPTRRLWDCTSPDLRCLLVRTSYKALDSAYMVKLRQIESCSIEDG